MGLRAPSSVIAALFMVLGCRGHTKLDEGAPALEGVEFAGCAAVDEGPVCWLHADRMLRVRIPASARDARAFGGEVTVGNEEAPQLWLLHVAEGRQAIRIEASVERGRAAWSLRVAGGRGPSASDVARALRNAGNLDDAASTLERARADATAAHDGIARAEATGALGRIAIVRGDLDLAARLLDDASDAEASAKRFSAAADDAFARGFALEESRRFGDARASIARGASWSRDYYEGRVMTAFHEGAIAREEGDLRVALRRLGDAETMARRLGLSSLARTATGDRALAWSEAGLYDDALRELASLAQLSDGGPCDQVDPLLNEGWVRLLKNDARAPGGALEDAVTPLTAALDRLTATCRDARREANARTNLAWASVQRGDLAAARVELARARAMTPEPTRLVASFWIHLEAQMALEQGDARGALAAYDALAARGRASGAIDEVWRAADGRAEALVALDRRKEALAACETAAEWLEGASRAVAIDEGRASFIGARERTARRHVELLIDAGAAERALAVARAAHARALADVEQRDRVAALDPRARASWDAALASYRDARDAIARDAVLDASRSTEAIAQAKEARRAPELAQRQALDAMTAALPKGPNGATDRPPPDSGVRLVAFFPLIRGWAAFVDDGRVVRVTRLASLDLASDDASLGHALLDPLARSLDGATRIALVVHGALAEIDVHALPFRGAPLIALAPVEYVLDLGSSFTAAHALGDRAAVISDPTSDLPSARLESKIAVASLGGAIKTLHLEGTAATRSSVLRAIDGADFVHFAGHGTFTGVEGWSSEVALADGALGVGDLLAMGHAPRVVVLSGCETARSAVSDRAAGMGIAQAFLAAGSENAIGATRAVDDVATREIMSAFYEALARDPSRDVAVALRASQLAQRAMGRQHAWRAFRALKR